MDPDDLEENFDEVECVWKRIPMDPDDLGENSDEAECIWKRIPMDPDDLEENSDEAECVGRGFQWIRMTWKRILMKPSAFGRVRNLGFVKQS